MNSIYDRKLFLIQEALSWVEKASEQGGNNRGQIVELFQKTIGKAENEPWCMAFMQYCVSKVDFLMNDGTKSPLFKSEHCLTVWNNTPITFKYKVPSVGNIVIWRHGTSSNGHTGVVKQVLDAQTFITVEGNTNADGSREGDGVYEKKRSILPMGDLNVVGFIKVW